jgi:ribosomal protein L7Ae-like RNA K-turn-binding protein
MSGVDPVLFLLGIAAKAGAVLPGTERVREAAGSSRLRYAIVAGDASENTRAKIMPALRAHGVAHAVAFDRDRLGAALGRAPLSVVGVTNESLAQRMKSLLEAEGSGR